MMRALDDVSAQLNDISKLIHEQHTATGKFINDALKNATVSILELRDRADVYEEKGQKLFYYKGLITGLLLGIMGNIFVSYFIKTLEIFNIPSEGWVLATSVALIVTFVLIWLFGRGIKKLSKEFSSS